MARYPYLPPFESNSSINALALFVSSLPSRRPQLLERARVRLKGVVDLLKSCSVASGVRARSCTISITRSGLRISVKSFDFNLILNLRLPIFLSVIFGSSSFAIIWFFMLSLPRPGGACPRLANARPTQSPSAVIEDCDSGRCEVLTRKTTMFSYACRQKGRK